MGEWLYPFVLIGEEMGNLLNQLAYDAVNTFITDFAEPVVYTPYNGSPVTLNAVIYRHQAVPIAGLSGAAAYKHEIHIANDPTYGVTSVTRSKDTVQFSTVVGGASSTFVVMEIINTDQGLFLLGVG